MLLATGIAAYGLDHASRGVDSFDGALRESFSQRPWTVWFHIVFGPIALVAGALNFRHAIRRRWPKVHRRIGETYVLSTLLTGLAGAWLAIFAYGGVWNRLGFGGLAFATLFTTSAAWRYATRHDFREHRKWMIRSYAMILAAVTLRIELPLLAMWFKAFAPAYAIVAWSCWVPNLLVAEWIVRRTRHVA